MKKIKSSQLKSIINEELLKLQRKLINEDSNITLKENIGNAEKIIVDSPIYSPKDDSTDYRLVYIQPKDSTNPLDGVVKVERNFKREGEWSGTPGRWYLGTLLKGRIGNTLMIDGGLDRKVEGVKEAMIELLNKLSLSDQEIENLLLNTKG